MRRVLTGGVVACGVAAQSALASEQSLTRFYYESTSLYADEIKDLHACLLLLDLAERLNCSERATDRFVARVNGLVAKFCIRLPPNGGPIVSTCDPL
jgi:hypothetical protein